MSDRLEWFAPKRFGMGASSRALAQRAKDNPNFFVTLAASADGRFLPQPGAVLIWPLRTSRAIAAELMLTGREVCAEEALRLGLVNRVVPDDELDHAVLDLITRATRGSVWSKAVGKRTFYDQIGLDQPMAYEIAIDVMADAAVSPDAQEGIDAFLNKRHPEFRERP